MTPARGSTKLLDQIEGGGLDPSTDLPSLLRKCITLGGATGSERLREWAVLELKGYGPDDELPPYRLAAAPLLLDGVTGNLRVSGQAVPINMIPAVARDKLTTEVRFPQPIAEIAHLLASARNRGEEVVRLGPPGGEELVALINNDLAKADRSMFPATSLERIYWSVNLAPIASIIDVVRTTLVELVAEMRAGTRSGEALPSREIAEQAVDIAINGKRNRVVINQVGAGGQAAAAAGGAASAGREAEPPSRRVMWWVVGVAAIVTAIAAVWVLFL